MLMASAFEIEPAAGGISYVRVCIFGAVHVDLTADLRTGNPSRHSTALESRSVRECDGACRAGMDSLHLIVDVRGGVESSLREAMRGLIAVTKPREESVRGARDTPTA
jgi:hypothetical protein